MYIKYLIDRLYHRYLNIMFSFGVILMVNNTLALKIMLILITSNLGKIVVILVNYNDNKYIGIIFFILQFFNLLAYLEIIELNFLNLNKNIRRDIQGRATDDFNDSYFNSFETQDTYISKNIDQFDNDEIKVELKQYQDSDNDNQNTF